MVTGTDVLRGRPHRELSHLQGDLPPAPPLPVQEPSTPPPSLAQRTEHTPRPGVPGPPGCARAPLPSLTPCSFPGGPPGCPGPALGAGSARSAGGAELPVRPRRVNNCLETGRRGGRPRPGGGRWAAGDQGPGRGALSPSGVGVLRQSPALGPATPLWPRGPGQAAAGLSASPRSRPTRPPQGPWNVLKGHK